MNAKLRQSKEGTLLFFFIIFWTRLNETDLNVSKIADCFDDFIVAVFAVFVINFIDKTLRGATSKEIEA
jgi:hypothetical protein